MSTAPSDDVPGWEGRPVHVVVDLDAIAVNVQTMRSLIGGDCRLMAVVKANGYGHGAIPVAKAALEAGADQLAVATVDEAAQLRGAGIEAPILVLGAIGRNERPRAIGLGLSVVVTNAAFAAALAADAKVSLVKDPVPVHLKVDTGMRRFGAAPDEAAEVAKAIAAHEQLRLDGVMTHLASADAEDPGPTMRQAEVFDRTVSSIEAAGIAVPLQHLSNSAATLRFPDLHRGMVRLGIAMYGLMPDPSIPLPAPMRPALTVHASLARVFDLEPGDAVGYGGTYEPTGRERAGLLTLGYGDGYRRALSSKAWVSIRGQCADVIGRVSMDQCVVRIPDGLDVGPGEPVIVVGNGTDATAGAPTLDELAPLAGTIGYEMATGLAARLPKRYLRNGKLTAIADLAGYRTLD
jgi:alanine racemase